MSAETIAIVEDDAAIRSVLKVALKGAGYSLVCEAERGDEGLRLVRERHPSLVLLDVMMSGLDGFEVLKRLREGKDTASIPVILLTAKSEEIDVVRNVFTVMKPKAARAGVGLVLLKAESARISCDAVLIEEAMTNLVENALRYSGSKTIELSLVRENGRAKISVVDHGIGIAEEHLPRLFERFYRVDKARSRQLGGTGLGLAIVKHIVQLHGGEASVVSNLGKGSKFSLVL